MNNCLNVGLMQSSRKNMSFENCLSEIDREVNNLMAGMNRPEIILGVEMGIGRYFDGDGNKLSGDTIPGRVSDRLGEIARKYGIYFVPGSMLEKAEKDGKTVLYNSAPVFGPDGNIIDVYRKMCPYLPIEENITPGEKYVTFDIKGKDIKIGVMICHDWCFPEISRNLALEGADILFRPAVDPEGLYEACRTIPQTRAFENQCYFISLNMCGEFLGSYAYGHSMVAAPDGHLVYEAGDNPACLTLTLDIRQVKDARKYGTCYTEQLLRQLPYFNPPMDVYSNLKGAPLYRERSEPDYNVEDRDKFMRDNNIQSICKDRNDDGSK